MPVARVLHFIALVRFCSYLIATVPVTVHCDPVTMLIALCMYSGSQKGEKYYDT